MKRFKVTVDGRAYDVLVEMIDEGPGPGTPAAVPPAPVPASPAPVAAVPKPQASDAGNVICPLAGKLVSIDVKAGQEVREGAQVATVEAMKMNTYIYASRAGTIVSVQHNPGEAVEEGSVILHIA